MPLRPETLAAPVAEAGMTLREPDFRLQQCAIDLNVEGVLRALYDGADPRVPTPFRGGGFLLVKVLQAHNDREASLTIAQLLLAAGANANDADPDGNAPLHEVAAYDVPELVDELIEAGARLEAVNLAGNTPLQQTLGRRRPGRCAAKLLQHGAEASNLTLHMLAEDCGQFFQPALAQAIMHRPDGAERLEWAAKNLEFATELRAWLRAHEARKVAEQILEQLGKQ